MLIGIHGYTPADSKAWQEHLKLTFLLASDRDLIVMKAYEVYNKEKLPHPTTIIIDKGGVIRFRDVHENYKERTTVDDILAVLKRLE